MFTIYKTLRSIIKGICADAAPWQIFCGTLLGVLIAFLPVFSFGWGPYPLGMALVIIALMVNVHLGSVLAFLGIGSLLGLILQGLAVGIGNGLTGVAQMNAGIPLLHASGLSNTGHLGMAIVGLVVGLMAAIPMAMLASRFQRVWRPILLEKKRLMRAGKVADNTWIMRAAFWFFGL